MLAQLCDLNVSSEDDFEWLSQLRYYWEEENMVTRMINSMLKYGYEYLGKYLLYSCNLCSLIADLLAN